MTLFRQGSKSLNSAFLGGLALAVMLQLFVAQPAFASHAYYEFVKNTISDSTLNWKDTSSNEFVTITKSWRAGSGANQDPCDKSTEQSPAGGWLPNGNYDLYQMINTKDCCEIRGRAWQLQDKACSDGTLRTELFIHSEETTNNGQDCPTSGDDPHCWENDDDYKSVGCIKVRYSEPGANWGMSEFHTHYHNDTQKGYSGHGMYTIPDFIWVHT